MPEPTRAELDEYAGHTRALANFRSAQAALYANTSREAAAGITDETDEDARLQQAVIDAGKKLPKQYKHLRKGV